MVSEGGVVGIWMVSIVVCGARMCLVGYLIAYPLQGGEFTLFYIALKGNLAIMRHQNIKMSIYILNKNGWVWPFLKFLMPVREKL